jgi:hypothetical protein
LNKGSPVLRERERERERERARRKILNILFVFVLFGIFLLLFETGSLYVAQSSLIPQSFLSLLPSTGIIDRYINVLSLNTFTRNDK